MKIVDIAEVTAPIASAIANAYIDFSKMTSVARRRRHRRRCATAAASWATASTRMDATAKAG